MSRVVTAALAGAFGLTLSMAAQAAPPVADYGRSPAVAQMQLSPSGDMLAYIASDQNGMHLVVAKVGGDVVKVVNVAGGVKLPDVGWAGNHHVLLRTYQTVATDPAYSVDKVLMQQSTLIDTTSGEISNVFRNERMIYHATYGYWGHASVGGRDYGYFGGLTLGSTGSSVRDFDSGGHLDNATLDLYRVDLATGGTQRVGRGSTKTEYGWLVDSAGVTIGQSEYDRRGGHWQLIGLTQGRNLLAEAEDPLEEHNLVGLGRRPGTLLTLEPVKDGGWTYLEYDAGGSGKAETLFAGATIDYPIADPLTGLLLGGVTLEEKPRTILFDPAQQAKFDKASRAFPGSLVTLISASSGLDRMIVLTQGPGDSGTYFFIDLPAKQAKAVGWNFPTILQDAVAAWRLVSFKAADGTPMDGVLTLPPGRPEKDLPLVVIPHGGPQSHDALGFDPWAQAFASRGYAVFQPNFRGSDSQGMAFRDAGFNEWGRKMQSDVSDGVAELVRQGVVDPKRACIFGASYGGYAALAGVTLQHGLYRCAVAFAPVTDLPEFVEWAGARGGQVSSTTRYWRRFMGADAGADLKAISPTRLAAQADAPILLIHGKDDTTVPVIQSRLMRDALKGAGKSVEYEEIAGEDHHLSLESSSIHVLEAAVAFVEKHNPAN